jgi:hypothetical protein
MGELAYPKERPVLTSLFNVANFPGQIIAAAICFGTYNIPNDWSWRIPSILQMCPSLLQMAFVLWVYCCPLVKFMAKTTQLHSRNPKMAYYKGLKRSSLRYSRQVPCRGKS